MMATADDIKRLREETSCGVIDCKKALDEAQGDFNKAKEVLRRRGLEMAAKKSDRVAKEGRVEAYVHNNKIGVIVEVNCETDFVARNEDFMTFARDVAMQISWTNPENVQALLGQAFIKDAGKTIQDYLNELIAKIGENIVIGRFTRIKIGE